MSEQTVTKERLMASLDRQGISYQEGSEGDHNVIVAHELYDLYLVADGQFLRAEAQVKSNASGPQAIAKTIERCNQFHSQNVVPRLRLRPRGGNVVMEHDLLVDTGLSDAQLDDFIRFIGDTYPPAAQFVVTSTPLTDADFANVAPQKKEK